MEGELWSEPRLDSAEAPPPHPASSANKIKAEDEDSPGDRDLHPWGLFLVVVVVGLWL